jgi:recombination protein RecA
MAMQSRSAALRQEIESSLASRIPAALSPQAVQAPRLLPIGDEAVNALLGGQGAGCELATVCGVPLTGRLAYLAGVFAARIPIGEAQQKSPAWEANSDCL